MVHINQGDLAAVIKTPDLTLLDRERVLRLGAQVNINGLICPHGFGVDPPALVLKTASPATATTPERSEDEIYVLVFLLFSIYISLSVTEELSI